MVAIDGPLIPTGGDPTGHRTCEQELICSPYTRRCKPGLSHFGMGLELRRAASQLSLEVSHEHLASDSYVSGPFVRPNQPIVEAFPNAFIGVLLGDEVYSTMPRLKRGRKFDWLYDRPVDRGSFRTLMDAVGWRNSWLQRRLCEEKGHEQRAALVWLLTAGLALSGDCHTLGDSAGGWFWLPPIRLWERWAVTA